MANLDLIIFKIDSLIEIDIFNEEKAYEKFLLLKETFQKCQQFPYLVSSTYEVLDFLF